MADFAVSSRPPPNVPSAGGLGDSHGRLRRQPARLDGHHARSRWGGATGRPVHERAQRVVGAGQGAPRRAPASGVGRRAGEQGVAGRAARAVRAAPPGGADPARPRHRSRSRTRARRARRARSGASSSCAYSGMEASPASPASPARKPARRGARRRRFPRPFSRWGRWDAGDASGASSRHEADRFADWVDRHDLRTEDP